MIPSLCTIFPFRRPHDPSGKRLALKLAKDLINRHAYDHIANDFLIGELDTATRGVLENAGYASRLSEFSSDINEFLTVMACLLSPKMQDHLRNKFESFDNLCGAPLSGAFLAERTISQWAKDIICNVLLHFQRQAREKLYGHQPKIPVSFANAQNASTPAPAPPPIQQVQLQDESLEDAWAAEEDMEQIYDFERIPGLQSWIPSTPGGAPVFWGIIWSKMRLITSKARSLLD